MRAGSVGDVGRIGDDWSVTLYDNAERELLAFVFADEPGARKAAKAMQDVIARAVALSATDDHGFVVAPIRKA